MTIATDYKNMRNSGKTPRFEEAFAFKHILNAEDSAAFLSNENPLDKHGNRVTDAMLNTDRAYTQAMNRFNTPAVTATNETILEPVENPPRVIWQDDPRSGKRTYTLPVQRGWKFTRIENDNKAPNYTKCEAQLVAQFTSQRTANMSCMGTPGVVNHWDQLQNQMWFG
jgi:hypothetical protein